MADEKIPGLKHLMSVPIIGQKRDDKGIALLEGVLAQMKEGKLLSVAVVAESDKGEMIMNFSHGHGQVVRMIGSLTVLTAAMSIGIIQGSNAASAKAAEAGAPPSPDTSP